MLLKEKSQIKNIVKGTVLNSPLLKFKEKEGYWDLTYYPYGGDFKRFQSNQQGTFKKGTVKMGSDIRCVIGSGANSGHEIICSAQAIKTMDGKKASFDKVLSYFNKYFKL